MKSLLFVLLFSINCLHLSAQQYTISGYVKDADSGETLIGATIFAKEQQTGAATNAYGYYSVTVAADSVTLAYSYVGFETTEKKILVDKNISLDIELSTGSSKLDEIVVSANSAREQVNSTQMSVDQITAKQAKVLPALFGEVDIIKTLQLKPGVASGGEGTSGIVVRGGGPDQNLFVLDEALVYNPAHLFGFFSTFNPDAVKGVTIYKGGFPAHYGGRLSSVVDVKLREGNRKRIAVRGGLGVISSRLTVEGPIQKDKASFIISGRRTYVEPIFRAVNKSKEDDPDFSPIPDYFFHDLNGKVNYDLGKKDRLFISGYYGKDKFKFKGDDGFSFDFAWGNITTTARWNHIFSPKLFANTTFTFSDYNYAINFAFDVFDFEIGSGIRDFNGKYDFYYAPNNKHNIRFGVEATQHRFDVGRLEANSTDEEEPIFDTKTSYNGTEFGAYISDEYEISKKLKIAAGLRLSGFHNDKTFLGIEPRFALKYSVKDNISLKANYTRMYQYVHLVSNSGASLPTDIWYPSNNTVKPQISDQVALGVSVEIAKQFLLTNELYYKYQQRQIDFKDGADLFINPELDQEFVFGNGYSYGNELYFERTQGKIRGWVGYSLAWTWRKFEDINEGRRFAPRFDRRHDISLVAFYELNKRFTFTGSWVYNTGSAVSLATGRFFFQDINGTRPDFGTVYTERNGFRMASYHRLDLGMVINLFLKKPKIEGDITISSFNTYDRRNPYFIYYDLERDDNRNVIGVKAKQVSLFPILPSATFNFSF